MTPERLAEIKAADDELGQREHTLELWADFMLEAIPELIEAVEHAHQAAGEEAPDA